RNAGPFPDHVEVFEDVGMAGIIFIQCFNIIEIDFCQAEQDDGSFLASSVTATSGIGLGSHVFADEIAGTGIVGGVSVLSIGAGHKEGYGGRRRHIASLESAVLVSNIGIETWFAVHIHVVYLYAIYVGETGFAIQRRLVNGQPIFHEIGVYLFLCGSDAAPSA